MAYHRDRARLVLFLSATMSASVVSVPTMSASVVSVRLRGHGRISPKRKLPTELLKRKVPPDTRSDGLPPDASGHREHGEAVGCGGAGVGRGG